MLVYNLVFAAPLLALLLLLIVAGQRGARLAAVARSRLQRYVPVALPAAVAIIGLVLVMLGTLGLARTG